MNKSLGNAKLIYINSIEQQFARGGDQNRMYLAWHVHLGFDKFYPGDVSGLTVILWADTGEVCSIDRVIVDSGITDASAQQTIYNTTESIEAIQPHYNGVTTQAIGISVLAGIVFVLLSTSKLIVCGGKKRVCKYLGALLCISVACSMILLPSAMLYPL